jgi:hypothetical protein
VGCWPAGSSGSPNRNAVVVGGQSESDRPPSCARSKWPGIGSERVCQRLLLFSRVSFYLLLYILRFLFYPLPNLVCLLFYTFCRLLHLLFHLLLYLLLPLLHLLLYLFFYSRSTSCRAKHREQSGREEDSKSSPHASPSFEINLLSGPPPVQPLQTPWIEVPCEAVHVNCNLILTRLPTPRKTSDPGGTFRAGLRMIVHVVSSRRKRGEREHRQDQATPPSRGASAGVRRGETPRPPSSPPPPPSLRTRQATGQRWGVAPDPAPPKVARGAAPEVVSPRRPGSPSPTRPHARPAAPRLSSWSA